MRMRRWGSSALSCYAARNIIEIGGEKLIRQRINAYRPVKCALSSSCALPVLAYSSVRGAGIEKPGITDCLGE